MTLRLALLLALTAESHGKPALESYTETIPGTDVSFEMVAVPAGSVRLPVQAEGDDPAYAQVDLPAFWIGKCEVTWGEYRKYMALDKVYAELQQLTTLKEEPAAGDALEANPTLLGVLGAERATDAGAIEVDAVTAPTPLYDPSTTYESGEDPDLPAVTMTPFAARQYTKWLSGLTGRSYRLPSEAEWIYAAAAGAETDSVSDEINDAAWHTDNSDWTAQTVGSKAPNAFGLYDTLGNAAELVLDGNRAEGRPELAGKRLNWSESIAWPRDGDPHFAKGGWYDGETEELTFTGRMPTEDEDWKASDPNLPMSPWWYADYPATGVGFRIVRTAEPIPEELQRRVWDAVEVEVLNAVTERLREGRGKLGPIGRAWPTVLEELATPEVRALLK